MKTISIELPPPLANWLSRRASRLGRSQSELVREALEAQKTGKAHTNGKSCAELMEKLGGFFEGPSDLATNPKYLADFGK
jgi:Arc/MetJ-type ribon-helix-helix transcriptional regulator